MLGCACVHSFAALSVRVSAWLCVVLSLVYILMRVHSLRALCWPGHSCVVVLACLFIGSVFRLFIDVLV